jgi:hypothetical protein
MKALLLALISISSLVAAEDEPHIRIEARYDGFEGAVFSDAMTVLKPEQRKQPLTIPSVTARTGQHCMVEIVRMTEVPGQKDAIPTGVILEILPTFKDGRIEINGKSTVRRALTPGTEQPIPAFNFETRETFFGGVIEEGKALVLRAGDNTTDKATITISAKLISVAK